MQRVADHLNLVNESTRSADGADRNVEFLTPEEAGRSAALEMIGNGNMDKEQNLQKEIPKEPHRSSKLHRFGMQLSNDVPHRHRPRDLQTKFMFLGDKTKQQFHELKMSDGVIDGETHPL